MLKKGHLFFSLHSPSYPFYHRKKRIELKRCKPTNSELIWFKISVANGSNKREQHFVHDVSWIDEIKWPSEFSDDNAKHVLTMTILSWTLCRILYMFSCAWPVSVCIPNVIKNYTWWMIGKNHWEKKEKKTPTLLPYVVA